MPSQTRKKATKQPPKQLEDLLKVLGNKKAMRERAISFNNYLDNISQKDFDAEFERFFNEIGENIHSLSKNKRSKTKRNTKSRSRSKSKQRKQTI